MKNYNILIVDDDPDIIEVASLYLTNAGYNVHTANNSTKALKKIEDINFHLIILDIMLPDLEGLSLCQKIRQNIYCPIIFISCYDDEDHILNALYVGGDDYIRKPFNYKELIARVKSNLRRVQYYNTITPLDTDKLIVNDLTIDLHLRSVLKKTREIFLSPLEFDILVFMVRNPNKVLTYSEIYEHVWKSESIGDTRTVMVHVSNLRKKIQSNGKVNYIQTVKKIGYKFSVL